MKIILAYSRNKKCKIKTIGNTLDLLTLFLAISKSLAEKISNEKEINISDAEKFIVECIYSETKTIKSVDKSRFQRRKRYDRNM